MTDRRKFVVLGALALVAVLVFVLGSASGGGEGGADRWQERLHGVGGGRDLTPSDLALVSGSCELGAQEVRVPAACVLEVEPTGGRFSLGAPTRRATLVNQTSPLRLMATVEGQEIAVDLEPGEDVLVTFGRSGGTLALLCAGGPGAECVVTFAPE